MGTLEQCGGIPLLHPLGIDIVQIDTTIVGNPPMDQGLVQAFIRILQMDVFPNYGNGG